MKRIETRQGEFNPKDWIGWNPVAARAVALRGGMPDEDRAGLDQLLRPNLKGLEDAVAILVDAIRGRRRIVCVADYDSDGAHSAVVIARGLRMLGASDVDFVVPDRLTMGYGLTRGAVDLAIAAKCQVLVTVDCGISNQDGVRYARANGMTVIITDHHECPEVLPEADAIVNPRMRDCPFESKNLAGVGVAFYLMIAVRARLRDQGMLEEKGSLAELLPYVCTGTVGDLVRLDRNNRILVSKGLERIRSGRVGEGYRALAISTGTGLENMGTQDIAFKWVPALNAAGRIANMRAGIECLLASEEEPARRMAGELSDLNRQRREMQKEMVYDGEYHLDGLEGRAGVCIYDETFHQGIVGLLASRFKEQLYRPVMVFAPGNPGEIKGSGRSIPGINIRDAMLAAGALAPEAFIRGGGHSAACGLSLHADRFEEYREAFDRAVRHVAFEGVFQEVMLTDGRLEEHQIDIDLARAIERAAPWGQGFEEPRFVGEFRIVNTRTMGQDGTHVRYTVDVDGQNLTAVHFGGAERIQKGALNCIYQISVNRWNGREEIQLRVEELIE